MIDHCGVSLSKQHTADLLLFMAHSRINAKPGTVAVNKKFTFRSKTTIVLR